MDRATFDKSLAAVVSSFGARLIAQHPELVWKTDWQGELFNAYENERQAIRKQMGLAPDLAEHRIDRHKIAAALTRAIMRVGPLVACGMNPSAGARLSNENLTLLSGMGIVLQMAAKRLETSAPDELKKIKGKPIKFPPANDGSYSQHYCKALHHTRKTGVDALIFSHTFFLLESFHLAGHGVTSLPVCPTAKELDMAA